VTEHLTASVVIPTFRRPDHVRACLEHLAALHTAPVEIFVVDASPDDDTRAVVARFPATRYVRNDLGAGRTPESRALGVDLATGDVVAFVDDDGYVAPDWLDELLAPYADPAVAGVGGRIVNGTPGEDRRGLDRIGRLLPDGRLLGNFTADPGRVIAVDHFIGANMSFRRRALLDVGGVYGDYPAPCVCEESDIALRQRALGRRLVYNPAAVVRHVSAPYSIRGDRLDRRWHYIARRNHTAMLIRVFGPASDRPRRYAATVVKESARSLRTTTGALVRSPSATTGRKVLGALIRTPLELGGVVVGGWAGVRARRTDARRLSLAAGGGQVPAAR
jgi:GT2 family glycosyltransferase